MGRTLAVVVFVVACVPPSQPGYYNAQQPGYQQGAPPPQPGAPVAAAASCQDTLACYGQCNPLTTECTGACDQRTSPQSAQLAHDAIACMAQSGCSDQNCVAERCGTQLAACSSAFVAQQPQPQAPPAGAEIDLAYAVPAGWQQSRMIPNAITVSFDKADYYSPKAYRIHIFPSRAYAGSITDTYHAIWNEMVPGEFDTKQLVGPLRRRLASGFAMALDAANTTIRANGRYTSVGLYLVYTDDRVVPILTTGLDSDAAAATNAFFDALTIRGASPSTAPLFATADLVGHWSTQAASIASYVDSHGNYRGDASIATAQTYDLEANGTFKSHFVGVHGGGGGAVQQDDHGTWKIEDDTLVLAGARTDRIRIWAHGTSPQGATDAICMVHYGAEQPRFWSPPDGIGTSWYGKVTN